MVKEGQDKRADQAQRVHNVKQKPKKKSRLFLIIILLAVIIGLLFFSTRIYLAVNLLLGNDIVVKFSSDKDSLNLKHLESEEISFNTYVLTNPLCSAECSFEFSDLSSGRVIDSETFTLKPAITKSKEYTVTANKVGKGQDLYRFNIRCAGVKTFWCHTTELNRTRSVLVTVNYDLNDAEKALKNSSKVKIEQLIQEASSLSSEIEGINLTLNNLTSLEGDFSSKLKDIKLLLAEYNNSAFNLKEKWENQEYNLFPPEGAIYEVVPSEMSLKLNTLTSSLTANISDYNKLIDNLTAIKQNLENLRKLNLTNTTLIEMDNAIDSFNNAIDEFSNKTPISEKSLLINNISVPIIGFDENASLTSNKTIKEIPQKLTVITIQPPEINITFKEPLSQCCLFGECKPCCENCSETNYPIIFLHGHAFNQGISAEYSLETFQEMQQKLEEKNYLNAGSILIGAEKKGVWSEINAPLAIRASYYFDLYKNPKESSIIQTKSDSLDTYALRLRDIISTAKDKTGKDKVIIVAHSMGGLVARQYIQIFGTNDIEKLILVGTPNHGIDSNIQKFCSIIGESLECRDMSKDSLFINKLNYAEAPNIQIYNIIGTGCKMGNETGDGIVTKSSAYLEGAKNYEINGTCNEYQFDFLHSDMIYPDKYPEVYKIISESLK
jgi:triacylglycerol esterase/lipase EstA (alpha/beta hydrolase family)/prefoldin subunit 5